MHNFNRLSVLLQRRDSFREHIVSLGGFLRRCDSGNSADFSQLQLRYERLTTMFSKMEDVFDEIQLIDADFDHSIQRGSIQDLYYQTIADAKVILNSAGTHSEVHTMNSNSSLTDVENRPSLSSMQCYKPPLPALSLPEFSGKIEDWLSFKDSFNAFIQKRDDLPDSAKFKYLKSQLKGEALRKVKVFSMTGDNYSRAWDLLKKAYEDKRMLISRHLILLLRLPVQEKETYEGLIVLADETMQHIQSLESLDVKINPEIIVTLIEEKLHKNTLEKWEETIKRGEFPKLDTLIEFLYGAAARMSKRKRDFSIVDDKEAPPRKQSRVDHKRHAFVTSTKKCPVAACDEQHPLFRCGQFVELPVSDRFKIVKNAHLCFNCLRDHLAKDCKLGHCKKCNKKHNTLLHVEKSERKNDDSRS